MLVLFTPWLQAIPIHPTKPVNLSGEIQKWAWIDGTVSKSSGDGMLSSISTVPTYYIILKVSGVPKTTLHSLSSNASSQSRVAIMHPIAEMELKDDEIFILLDLELIETLKKGARLEIKDYTMQGDEWGCASDWSQLLLNSKPVPKRNRNVAQVPPALALSEERPILREAQPLDPKATDIVGEFHKVGLPKYTDIDKQVIARAQKLQVEHKDMYQRVEVGKSLFDYPGLITLGIIHYDPKAPIHYSLTIGVRPHIAEFADAFTEFRITFDNKGIIRNKSEVEYQWEK